MVLLPETEISRALDAAEHLRLTIEQSVMKFKTVVFQGEQ